MNSDKLKDEKKPNSFQETIKQKEIILDTTSITDEISIGINNTNNITNNKINNNIKHNYVTSQEIIDKLVNLDVNEQYFPNAADIKLNQSKNKHKKYVKLLFCKLVYHLSFNISLYNRFSSIYTTNH